MKYIKLNDIIAKDGDRKDEINTLIFECLSHEEFVNELKKIRFKYLELFNSNDGLEVNIKKFNFFKKSISYFKVYCDSIDTIKNYESMKEIKEKITKLQEYYKNNHKLIRKENITFKKMLLNNEPLNFKPKHTFLGRILNTCVNLKECIKIIENEQFKENEFDIVKLTIIFKKCKNLDEKNKIASHEKFKNINFDIVTISSLLKINTKDEIMQYKYFKEKISDFFKNTKEAPNNYFLTFLGLKKDFEEIIVFEEDKKIPEKKGKNISSNGFSQV